MSRTKHAVALGALSLFVLVESTGRAEPPPKAPVVARVGGLHSARGRVVCALFGSGDGFPQDERKALGVAACAIDKAAAQCVFHPLRAASYAIGCYHDENGNGKLDKSFLGIPSEGVGASNGAKRSFGPPKFDAAKFTTTGVAIVVPIRIEY